MPTILSTILKTIGLILAVLVLTVFTQIGGFVLLLSLMVAHLLRHRKPQRWPKWAFKTFIFLGTYLLFNIAIVPPLARLTGRVPLPVFSSETLVPKQLGYCLMNRHYVEPELKALLEDAGKHLSTQFPGTAITYLDANLPFWDGFPLLPHLSHNDGEKVDLAFFYQDEAGAYARNHTRTWLGYGSIEAPTSREKNWTEICLSRGYWQYNFIETFTGPDEDMALDRDRTASLIRYLARSPKTGKILLEPHLKYRWGLGGFNKIRFHGCHAVRHDDHIHLQL
ncbi:hypothetical protein [Pontibacter sp. G13]|uniref:hypothetical protein n=1 Tax=Pontibacter sp. G13 TaxID=3074898 RepID=UPI002889B364|nr:hypothetical protein [Pontibacter sp. G13]WNJ17964.1 hypothetical protein RJD25_24175 [Pontibacter sp. G13]